MYKFLFKDINQDALRVHRLRNQWLTLPKGLIIMTLLGVVAAGLQSAGDILPGIGYFISSLATLPILIATIHSVPFGLVAYFVTVGILSAITPSELYVFSFTTGLFGLGLGTGFLILRNRLTILAFSSSILTLGISFLLYIIQFPILGPKVTSSFHLIQFLLIYLFALLYSWLWVEGSRKLWQYMRKI